MLIVEREAERMWEEEQEIDNEDARSIISTKTRASIIGKKKFRKYW